MFCYLSGFFHDSDFGSTPIVGQSCSAAPSSSFIQRKSKWLQSGILQDLLTLFQTQHKYQFCFLVKQIFYKTKVLSCKPDIFVNKSMQTAS